MKLISTASDAHLNDLIRKLADRLKAGEPMVLPYSDFTDMLTDLLGHVADGRERLVVAGHATPDVQIAADRAGMQVTEVLGVSPFVHHNEDLLEVIRKDSIVYIANPNWVSGANYSALDLERIAGALTEGTLFIDEKYFDYYGITGLNLLQKHAQVIVLRSLTAGFSIGSDDSGILISSPGFVRGIKGVFGWSRLSTTMHRILSTTLVNMDIAEKRLREVRDESLRLATELTRLGIQNRITATDFLLLRVADPKRVGNHMAAHKTPVENLDGYPEMKHYMRYRVQSPLSNDRFLTAASRMPKEFYHLKDLDRRAVMFHRASAGDPQPESGEVLDRGAVEVLQTTNQS